LLGEQGRKQALFQKMRHNGFARASAGFTFHPRLVFKDAGGDI